LCGGGHAAGCSRQRGRRSEQRGINRDRRVSAAIQGSQGPGRLLSRPWLQSIGYGEPRLTPASESLYFAEGELPDPDDCVWSVDPDPDDGVWPFVPDDGGLASAGRWRLASAA